MYRISKTDGTEVGITDSVFYIKIADNGCFVSAKQNEAIGVSYDSVPYNLLGHKSIDGADTVLISEINGGAEIFNHGNLIDKLLIAALEG